MRNFLGVSAAVLASLLIIGQYEQGWAFKSKFKNPFNNQSQVSQPANNASPDTTNESASQPSVTSSGPLLYANEKFGFKVELPGQWQQMSGDAKSNNAMWFDQTGNQGSFQVNANWMADDFPVDSSLKAMAKSYEDRKKHGELEKYYRKDFTITDKDGKQVTVFQGYVTIESADDPDPDIRRMQWIGYGKGNYYNFTWASKPEQFETYLPEFEKILDKIEFPQQ